MVTSELEEELQALSIIYEGRFVELDKLSPRIRLTDICSSGVSTDQTLGKIF